MGNSIVTNSLTAVGNGTTIRVAAGETVNYAVTGSFSATWQLQKLVNTNALAAEVITYGTATATGSWRNDSLSSVQVRLTVSAFTSGTVGLRLDDVTTSLTNITSATTLTHAYAGRTFTINNAAGAAIVLPPAVGTGNTFKFIFGTTVTSNTVTITADSDSDVFSGVIMAAADGGDTVVGWELASSADTLTFDGTTRGGIIGDHVILTDIGEGSWHVSGLLASTGTEANPSSDALS